MPIQPDVQWLEATRRFWDVDSSFEARYRRICSDPDIDSTSDETVLQRLWEERTGKELAYLFDGIPLQPDWICLEIGCGVGRLLKPIARRCRKVIGVDISERMVAFAADYLRGVPNIEVHLNDGRGLPMVEDTSVDWVYSHLAFQHMTLQEIVEGYLAECARVLKPGGYLRIQCWREAPMPLAQRLKNAVRGLVGEEKYHGPRRWEWAPGREVKFGGIAYHVKDWRRLLRTHGFRTITTQLGLGHDYWMWTTCRKR
ncbi:MAG: methyltransferase domain-containing protein [Phycisphaerae bacterium]